MSYQCPHCGELFDALRDSLIPTHDFPRPCRSVCPGSKQHPRNPETDKRPLWKDGEEASGAESVDTIQRLRAELAVEGHALRAAATFLAGAATESFFLDIPEAARTHLRERLEQAQAAIEAAISPNSRRMLIKQEFEIAHWKEKADEAESLRRRLRAIAAKLEEVVCTKGCDKGVVLLSDHGTTHREEGVPCPVYDHEYFSPLGDALISAWELCGSVATEAPAP